MPTSWTGYYLDGRTASRHSATITLSPQALTITLDESRPLTWAYRDIVQTQGTYAGEPVRLERIQSGESLIVQSTTILEALHRFSVERQPHIHDPRSRRRRVHWTIAAGLTAVCVALVLYRWGIPLLSAVVAAQIPITWEQRIGETAVEHFASEDRRCSDPYRTQLVRNVLTAMTNAAPSSPYEFKLYLVDSPTVNAMAAPGGHIVVFRGLLERTESAEQLAGVLAHEIQHVLKRHSTRMLTEQILTAILLSTVSGDFSGAMTYGLQSVQLLGQLHYSQAHETEADEEGMRLILRAGLDPGQMIAFYRILGHERPDEPEILDYLSSHPRFSERISRLEQLAAQSGGAPKPMMPDFEWSFVRSACRKHNLPSTPPEIRPTSS